MTRFGMSLLALALVSHHAQADSLRDIYEMALQNDALRLITSNNLLAAESMLVAMAV